MRLENKTRLLSETVFGLIDSVAKKVDTDKELSDIKDFFSSSTAKEDDEPSFVLPIVICLKN